MKTAQYY